MNLSDLATLTDDYLSAKTGSISIERKYRAINRAIESLQRKIGLPSDERIHEFFFCEDQIFYPAPTAFMEQIQLLYHDPKENMPETEWEFMDDTALLLRSGSNLERKWSIATRNRSFQIAMLGANLTRGSTVEAFDEVGNWVASGDASGLAQDLLEFKVGDGALSFDITDSTHTATLTDDNVSLDVKTLFEKHAYFKLWVFMTVVANVDSWTLKLFVDDSNYWVITSDTFDDGSAFSTGQNSWEKVGFALDDATEVGTPEIDETVTKISISVDLDAAFTTATDFRVDHLFTVIPDKMDLTYYTQYKGTDSSGATEKVRLTAEDDVVYIGDFLPDIDDLVARRAALSLWPGLRADTNFMIDLRSETKEFLTDHGRRYPRRRTHRYLSTRLKR